RRGRVVEVSRGRRAGPVVAAGRLAHQLDDAREIRGTEDPVHLRHLFQDVAAVALGEAARDDEGTAGPPLLQLRELEDRVDRFLARTVDEGAGVDDEALGVFGALRERKPGLGQHAEHQLGVHLVLRAAEGRQMDLHGTGAVYLAPRAKSPRAKSWARAASCRSLPTNYPRPRRIARSTAHTAAPSCNANGL